MRDFSAGEGEDHATIDRARDEGFARDALLFVVNLGIGLGHLGDRAADVDAAFGGELGWRFGDDAQDGFGAALGLGSHVQSQPLRFETPLLHPLANRLPFDILALAVRLANESGQFLRLLPEFDFAQSLIFQELAVCCQRIAASRDGKDTKNEVPAR